MKLISITPSSDPNKKYDAKIEIEKDKYKIIKFGAKGYSDFIQSGDETKKNAYIARHSKNEDWNNPLTAGFWSRWVLWNKKTLKESISDVKNKFNL
jgi:hypothetical protein